MATQEEAPKTLSVFPPQAFLSVSCHWPWYFVSNSSVFRRVHPHRCCDAAACVVDGFGCPSSIKNFHALRHLVQEVLQHEIVYDGTQAAQAKSLPSRVRNPAHLLVLFCNTGLCLLRARSAALRKAARRTRSPQSHRTTASGALAPYFDFTENSRSVCMCSQSTNIETFLFVAHRGSRAWTTSAKPLCRLTSLANLKQSLRITSVVSLSTVCV